MRYYNQATGEFRFVPDNEEETIESIDYVETLVPRESKVQSQAKTNNILGGFNYFDWLGIGGVNLSNLNFDYIMRNLQFDDIILIGLIVLLISEWTEDDLYLVMILAFILISEWILVPKGAVFEEAA